MCKKILLIVDDEIAYARSLAFTLKREFDTRIASSYKEALRILNDENVDEALIDVRLDENDDTNKEGLRILEWINQNHPDITSFVMTSYKEMGFREEAMELGAAYFFEKPIDIIQMKEILAG